jgi:hypothetical protein
MASPTNFHSLHDGRRAVRFNGRTVGFISKGSKHIEAFDADGRSFGTYETRPAARDVVVLSAAGQLNLPGLDLEDRAAHE